MKARSPVCTPGSEEAARPAWLSSVEPVRTVARTVTGIVIVTDPAAGTCPPDTVTVCPTTLTTKVPVGLTTTAPAAGGT